MNAAIYARYSSHAQREESIEQQVEVCRRWCAAHGYEVAATYADEARSGRSTEGREQFLRMVDDAKGAAWSVVVVYKLDRFARDRYDAAIYRKRLRDAGVEVRSAMENIPDGPEGRLLEAVVEGVAEWYSADLSQKTLRGMRSNAERCMANGVQVYGYAIVDGTYAIDERQAAIVRRVFQEWAEGTPAAHIARRLADEGVRTARGRVPKKDWPGTIVHDERYLGTYVWGDVRVEGGMPRIVTDAEWVAAHNRPRRPSMAPKRTHDYALTGRIWDRATGLPMFGYSARGEGGEYTYYGVIEDGRRRLVRQHLVEGAVVRAVRAVLSDAALVDDVVARVMDWQRRTLDSPDVLGARATLRSVAAEEERLLDAIQAGVPLDGIRPRVDALNERKRAAQALLERREGDSVTPDAVRAAMEQLSAHGTPQAILRHCVSGVVVDRDARAVVVTLPVVDKKRAPTREGVSARSVWQPVGGHVSNVMWLVEGTTVVLRVPLAA